MGHPRVEEESEQTGLAGCPHRAQCAIGSHTLLIHSCPFLAEPKCKKQVCLPWGFGLTAKGAGFRQKVDGGRGTEGGDTGVTRWTHSITWSCFLSGCHPRSLN